MVFWFLAAAAVVAWAATSKSSEQSNGSESPKRGNQDQSDRKTSIDTQESSQGGSQRELRRRNINTVNQGVYAGLSLQSTSTDIRVIVLRRSSSASAPLKLGLKIVPLKSYYWALSYHWGDDCDVRSVSVNGKAFLATSSVCVALEHLRSPHYDQSIWIDAMCINQADETEMSFQWKLVRDIYSTASSTIVWLGPSTNASDVVIEHFGKWDHQREDLQIALVADSKRNLQAWRNFGDIVLRPYFSRLWIVQEVIVSRNPLAMCGKRSLALDMIPSILSVILDQKIPMIPFASRRWISPTQENVAMLGRFRRERNHSGPLDLKYWLRAYAGTHQCKRAKDRVFALIGVSTNGQDSAFQSLDYTESANEIYKQVTSQIVEKDQDLNFILAGRGPGRDLSLPSWVPDFRLNPENSFRGSMSSIFHVGNGFAAHGNHSASEPAVTANMQYSLGAEGRHDIFYDTLRQIMVVPGVNVDTITEVGDAYNLDPLKEMPEINTILSAPMRNHHQNVLAQSLQMVEKLGGEEMQKPYPGHFTEPYASALTRTLVGDRVDGKPCLEVKRAFHNYNDPDYQILPNEINLEGALGPDVLRMHLPRHRRRFMTTQKGLLGLAPPEAEIGDIVCVLFNCHVPVILRNGLKCNSYYQTAETEHHVFIGEGYVHGIMHGETMDDVLDGKTHARQFCLL